MLNLPRHSAPLREKIAKVCSLLSVDTKKRRHPSMTSPIILYETCQCVFVFIGNIDASLH